MIKLYNYDKQTKKYLRTLERENMPDNYEFCSLVPLPEDFNEETQAAVLNEDGTEWGIGANPNYMPVASLLLQAKASKCEEIYRKMNSVVDYNYPVLKKIDIILGVKGFVASDLTTMKNRIEDLYSQYQNFVIEVQAISEEFDTDSIIAVKNFEYEFN